MGGKYKKSENPHFYACNRPFHLSKKRHYIKKKKKKNKSIKKFKSYDKSLYALCVQVT